MEFIFENPFLLVEEICLSNRNSENGRGVDSTTYPR